MPAEIEEGIELEGTLLKMRNLVHAYKHDVASFIGYDLHEFYDVVKNIPYDDEEGKVGEIIRRPAITLRTKGDCDDKAILIAAYIEMFMRASVVRHGFKIVSFDDNWEHVYNTMQMPNGRWHVIDATYPENRFLEEPRHSESFFFEV